MFWLVVILFTLLTGIIFGIGGFLIHHWFFKPSNDPDKARIYIENINKPYEGRLAYESEEGACYCFNKNNTFVFVPQSYKIEYHYYKRTIYLDRIGNLIAIPFGDDKPLSSNAKNELIKELTQSHIGAEAIKAIKSSGNFGMGVVIIACIIVAIFAGVIGFAIHRPNAPQSTTVPSLQQTAPVVPKITIEGTGQAK